MKNRVFIVGVGTTKFEKPLTKNWEYYEIGREAGEIALNDARLKFDEIKAAVCSYCYGEPTCGQRAVYELGMTGIPIFNCNNNCSSGSSALMLASSLIKSNEFDCVLALGFEKMERVLSNVYTDRPLPSQKQFDRIYALGANGELIATHLNYFTSEVIKMFALAAREFEGKNENAREAFFKVAYKNHKHGSQNKNAMVQRKFTLEEIKSKKMLFEPINSVVSAPTSDGGAAVILCSYEYVLKHGLEGNAVEVLSQSMQTDQSKTFDGNFSDVCGLYLAKKGILEVFRETKMNIKEVDVLEVHDCFSPAELMLYEKLGLCEEGKAVELINTLEWVKNENGGEVGLIGDQKKWCVNPSGGLESKGHPIGASGISQCVELCLQLRNEARERQVPGNPKVGLQHNYGIGSSCVLSLYKKFILKNEDSIKCKI
ncbi:hypothetical protein HDU92_000984 [Lobulomyces angularis]|nr:hypothetical protein HDU92_000984 [Lobulomyces angularis]